MPPKPAYDRDSLIDRARDLFWSKGWSGTSMKDLERALNLRPGSFYAAFGSKARLYALALDRYAAEGAEALDTLERSRGPLDALKAHLLSFAAPGAGAARGCFLVRSVSELEGADSPLGAQAGTLLDAAEARFAALFERAQQAGQVAPQHDPKRLAQRYQAQLTGLRAATHRAHVDVRALAQDFATDLDRLAP
ncbi:MAG: TetR/AcrR family transcriptional regulator [Pseudomonadota bacterium]